MRTRFRYIIAALLLLFCYALQAQPTKVRGQVVDVDSGEPIQFAAVYFKGTNIGQMTNSEGRFSIETRDTSAVTLLCQLLGYSSLEIDVRKGGFTEITFRMKQGGTELSGAYIKADNRKVKHLLANINRNRQRHDPARRPHYTCDVYNKMVVSGMPYIPQMISETVAKRSHTASPELDREQIVANRISGVEEDNNLLSQFTGSMYLNVNFYKDYVKAFGVEFPSPIQASGMLYYNYYIIDTLQMDGRSTYQVRYHPKRGISSPAFDGEMFIDCEDYALRSIHAVMKRGGNVNWIRELTIDSEYRRLEDSTWFFGSDKMHADFSLALSDSSKLISFHGNSSIVYTNPDFSDNGVVDRASAPVKVAQDAGRKDEQYWDAVRPYGLSEKEKDITQMLGTIKYQSLYENLYTIASAIATGYVDIGPIGIGPVLRLVSFNELEGFRPQLGIRTSRNLSKQFRLSLYGAYGTKDREFKGGATYEHIFNREPTRKLTVDAHYDVSQLGKGQSLFTSGNILSSPWSGQQKPSPMTSFSATYEHEFSPSFNAMAEVALKRHFSNIFAPMKGWAGEELVSVASNELHLQARFSHDETVTRGYFTKTYIHTDYPVFTVDLTGSAGGIRPGDVSFLKPEVTADWKVRTSPLGLLTVQLTGGTIIGRVPYPFLHIHAGNVTGLLDKTAFSCMDYFEFISDTWATFFLDHNFYGFFLGKIPLLRRLQLREVVTLKAAWGHLSDRNNGTLPEYGAPMQFPQGMKSLDVPYVEAGVGVSNILRLFRVDCVWRLTQRDTARRTCVVNVGMELKF